MKVAIILLSLALAASGFPQKPKQKNFFAPAGLHHGRIVGGVEATPYEFPWIVDMRVGGSRYCAGSIISPEWVVTAAHCSGNSPSSYTLTGGEHNFNIDEGTEQLRNVVQIIVHPSYGSGLQYQYDIALMQVSPPYVFNDNVGPVSLATAGFQPSDVATVTGWGALSSGGGSPSQLMKVDVPYVNDTQCGVAYTGQISSDMVCYGEEGKDSCQGDSGGPIMCGDNRTLCGIVSWGRGCALLGYPGVYTEVSYFEDWIRGSTVPTEEDSAPVFEQVDTCGGYITNSSARINFFSNGSYTAGTKCTWVIKAPYNSLRFRLVSSGLAEGENLFATPFVGGPGESSQLSQVGVDYRVSGSLIVLTFRANSFAPAQGFSLEYYSSGFVDSSQLSGFAALSAASGSYSYPVGGGSYGNGENALFVVSPTGTGSAKTLSFTRMDVEGSGCIYDALTVYSWNNNGFSQVGSSFCGTALPSPFALSQGLGLVTFTTDGSVVGTGFDFNWA